MRVSGESGATSVPSGTRIGSRHIEQERLSEDVTRAQFWQWCRIAI